jgi:branched-chain amino acid transport system permease protein
LLAAVVVAVAFSMPVWVGDTYLLHLLAVSAVLSIAAMSLNLLVGVAGQISLAHGAFLGIGGYTTAILTTRHGWGFWPTVLVAVVMGGLAGALLGAPALRLRGHYLGMVTLGAGQIFTITVTTWSSFTGGANGIAAVPAPNVGGADLLEDGQLLRLFVVVAAFAYLLLTALAHSQTGRVMSAIRQDEVAAASLGIRAAGYKLLAFVTSSALASLCGALLVGLLGVASPASFNVSESILLLVMVVIGGLGSIGGAAVGAVAVTLLPEYLRWLDTWYQVAFGAAIVMLIMFFPGGLASLTRRSYEHLALLPLSPASDRRRP